MKLGARNKQSHLSTEAKEINTIPRFFYVFHSVYISTSSPMLFQLKGFLHRFFECQTSSFLQKQKKQLFALQGIVVRKLMDGGLP